MNSDLFRTVGDDVPQRSGRLVANKQNRRLFAKDVCLQVMFDPPRVTHSAGRNDHGTFLDLIDRLTLVDGLHNVKALVAKQLLRVHRDVLHLTGVLHKHTGRFSGQRRVQVNVAIRNFVVGQ